MAPKVKKLEDRFWALVDKKGKNDCWEWLGFRNVRGYGHFSVDSRAGKYRRKSNSHRVSFMLYTNKPIPDGQLVCHKCDNKLCVNPKHLFLGSPKDNTWDMIKKGRAHWQTEHYAKT